MVLGTVKQPMKAARRVAIIGIDGASPDIIYSLAAKGLAPNLQGLMESGARARLVSTIPPHSGPAWVTAITGKNPGKHGVFFFTTVNPKHSAVRIVSSHDIRTRTIFDELGLHGRKSIALNIPLTYPPWKIEGILVSGIFAPSETEVFTYPPEIGPEIAGRGYEVEFSDWDEYDRAMKNLTRMSGDPEVTRNRSAYRDRALDIDEKNVDAFLLLMGKHDWDLAMVVLPGLDRIQHILWRPLGAAEEDRDGEEFSCSKHVIEAYRRVDTFVGRIIRKLDENTWVILLSDHGFGATSRIFHLNRWLEDTGFLVRQRKKGVFATLRGSIGPSSSKGAWPEPGKPTRTAESPSFHGLLPISALDMSRTKAYAPTPYGLLNLNATSEGESRAIEKELVSKLEHLQDPVRGVAVLKRVHLSNEIYKGPHQREASDMLLEPNPDYYIANGLESDGIITDAVRYPASHKPEGILLFSGPEVQQGFELLNANICDVAPTTLRLLGLPLPKDMDGAPLDQALDPRGEILKETIVYSEIMGAREEVAARVKDLRAKGRL